MGTASVVFVTYGTPVLHLGWIPADAPVTIVQNDTVVPRVVGRSAAVRRVVNRQNVGFGQAVNQAAALAGEDRLVVCNPDTLLDRRHWRALAAGQPHQLVTIPLCRPDGRPTAVVEPYPRPLATIWKVVANGTTLLRLVPAPLRQALASRAPTTRPGRQALIEPWSRQSAPGVHPLRERWVCGAAFSVDRRRFLAVGGFDPAFFLYFEDMDLCARMAARDPSAEAVVADVEPGVHQVGASASTEAVRALVRREWCRSASVYAARQPGYRWRLAAATLRPFTGAGSGEQHGERPQVDDPLAEGS